MKRIEYDKIVAMQPVYIKGSGDCTQIVYENGNLHLTQRNIKTCITAMADYYCVNMQANRRVYGKTLNIANKVPYVFSDKRIMVQYKSRVPICKKDGASGYFDVHYFDGFVEEDGGGYILLKNGHKLKLEQKIESCKKYVNYGELLKYEKR